MFAFKLKQNSLVVAQLANTFLAKIKPWIQSPALNKPGVHTCNPRLWEVEAGESGIQSYLPVHGKLDGALGYVRHCLNNPPICKT